MNCKLIQLENDPVARVLPCRVQFACEYTGFLLLLSPISMQDRLAFPFANAQNYCSHHARRRGGAGIIPPLLQKKIGLNAIYMQMVVAIAITPNSPTSRCFLGFRVTLELEMYPNVYLHAEEK